MLDTMTEPRAEVAQELGVGIRFACQVGNGRQIEMTAGIPLEWQTSRINEVLDKLAGAMDRQSERYKLLDMRTLLERTEKDIETNQSQKARLESQFRDQFSVSGKRGDWRPAGNQAKQLENYDNSIQHLAATLKKLREDIRELEEKCR